MSDIELSITGGIGDAILKVKNFDEIKLLDPTIKTICHSIVHSKFALDYIKEVESIDQIIEHTFDIDKNRELYLELGKSPNYLGEAESSTPYPYVYFKHRPDIIKNFARPITIIHQYGSEFSDKWITEKYNKHDKSYDVSMWNKLVKHIDKNFGGTIVIVGSKNDLNRQKIEHPAVINMMGKCDVNDFMTLIYESDLIIGVDSAAKAAGLAMRKNTIVLVHKYQDLTRDAVFLTPYENTKFARILRGDDEREILASCKIAVDSFLEQKNKTGSR